MNRDELFARVSTRIYSTCSEKSTLKQNGGLTLKKKKKKKKGWDIPLWRKGDIDGDVFWRMNETFVLFVDKLEGALTRDGVAIGKKETCTGTSGAYLNLARSSGEGHEQYRLCNTCTPNVPTLNVCLL